MDAGDIVAAINALCDYNYIPDDFVYNAANDAVNDVENNDDAVNNDDV